MEYENFIAELNLPWWWLVLLHSFESIVLIKAVSCPKIYTQLQTW